MAHRRSCVCVFIPTDRGHIGSSLAYGVDCLFLGIVIAHEVGEGSCTGARNTGPFWDEKIIALPPIGDAEPSTAATRWWPPSSATAYAEGRTRPRCPGGIPRGPSDRARLQLAGKCMTPQAPRPPCRPRSSFKRPPAASARLQIPVSVPADDPIVSKTIL